LEKKLRRQKEMLEQMLNQKVNINYMFLILKIFPNSRFLATDCIYRVTI
jgi:hypothetical protein